MTTVEAVTGRTSRLRTYLELVRFSHTVFALPFAIMAVLIAVRLGGDGVWSQPILWLRMSAGVLLCMISARTAAMAFNRLVDRQIDAANPRTANRHLPRGDVRVDEVLLLIAGSSATFIASTLLFWLLGYSYAKRFTMLAHVWLGVALGLAPVAAWIALRGSAVLANPADLLPAALLGIAVALWVSGFDTIYACQDAQFDAAQGLQSIPARLGVPRALRLAAILHALTIAVLAVLPLVVPQLGVIYWSSLAIIAALLVWEHAIVRPDDLSRVNDAFFTANAVIGVVLMAAIAADLWL